MRTRLSVARLALAALCSVVASGAAGQPPEPASPDTAPPPLTLSYVDGRVDVVRASGVEAARAPDLLEEDDRLVVADGRAELVFDDGPIAHLDRDADVRVDLGVRLRLVRGRAIVHTLDTGAPLVVATPAGPVALEPDGEYHLTADDLQGDTEVAVVRGQATLEGPGGDAVVRDGEAVRLDPRDRRARFSRGFFADAFSDWSARRLRQLTVQSGPVDVLPPAARPWAADFALYGAWTSLPPYGPVWFPARGAGWRPYVDGSWRHTRYGWTWIDAEPWAWPLHHYGRWGLHPNRGWYWIPERRWAPAWVGWAVAADHVAWAPLGWDARPVVDFFAGVRIGPVGAGASAWSILPRFDFGRRGPVRPWLRDPRALPGPVLGGFVSQMIGPRGPADADDRFGRRSRPGQAAPRWPGRDGAVPRAPQGPDADDRRAIDPPRPDAWGRRPMDAPRDRDARDGDGTTGAPGWTPAPGRRRDPGDVAPVGAPVPPRVAPGTERSGRDADRPRDGGGWAVPRGPRGGGDRGATPGTAGPSNPPAEGATSGGGGGGRAGVRGPGAGDGGSVQGGRRAPSGEGRGGAAGGSPRGPRPRRN